MKNSSENKKSQTRSSIMKATINNDVLTFGTNSISTRSVKDEFPIYIDAWPEGKCSTGNPCWNWSQKEITEFDRETRFRAWTGFKVYTSRPRDQFPEKYDEMCIGNPGGKWAPFCESRKMAVYCNPGCS